MNECISANLEEISVERWKSIFFGEVVTSIQKHVPFLGTLVSKGLCMLIFHVVSPSLKPST